MMVAKHSPQSHEGARIRLSASYVDNIVNGIGLGDRVRDRIEQALGYPRKDISNQFIEHGIKTEPVAAQAFADTFDIDTPFYYNCDAEDGEASKQAVMIYEDIDDRLYGFKPDGWIVEGGKRRLVELKCPHPMTQVTDEYTERYKGQCRFSLYVAKFYNDRINDDAVPFWEDYMKFAIYQSKSGDLDIYDIYADGAANTDAEQWLDKSLSLVNDFYDQCAAILNDRDSLNKYLAQWGYPMLAGTDKEAEIAKWLSEYEKASVELTKHKNIRDEVKKSIFNVLIGEADPKQAKEWSVGRANVCVKEQAGRVDEKMFMEELAKVPINLLEDILGVDKGKVFEVLVSETQIDEGDKSEEQVKKEFYMRFSRALEECRSKCRGNSIYKKDIKFEEK